MNIIQTLYVCEDNKHDGSNTEYFGFTQHLEEAKVNALNHFQRFTNREKEQYDVWINEYKLYPEDICPDDEQTFNKMLENDQNDRGWLRDPINEYKLNRIHCKFYGSNVRIWDDFGDGFNFSLCRDDLPDDLNDAIDYMYDSVEEILCCDKWMIRESKDLIVYEGILEGLYHDSEF